MLNTRLQFRSLDDVVGLTSRLEGLMRRRNFLSVLAGAAAWPPTVRAQQRAMPVIGFLRSWEPDRIPKFAVGFEQGLKEIGLVEGRDFTIEYRSTGGQIDRVPA